MRREPGVYGLEELISDTDGSLAYQYQDHVVTSVMSGSWEAAQEEPDESIMWTVSDLDDSDEPEVAMTAELFSQLMERARIGARYAGCTACERVTQVG